MQQQAEEAGPLAYMSPLKEFPGAAAAHPAAVGLDLRARRDTFLWCMQGIGLTAVEDQDEDKLGRPLVPSKAQPRGSNDMVTASLHFKRGGHKRDGKGLQQTEPADLLA
eukprot:scaffold12465_cov17-Tisochrysis_lutea.AAC.1